jgi:hypothetical protein
MKTLSLVFTTVFIIFCFSTPIVVFITQTIKYAYFSRDVVTVPVIEMHIPQLNGWTFGTFGLIRRPPMAISELPTDAICQPYNNKGGYENIDPYQLECLVQGRLGLETTLVTVNLPTTGDVKSWDLQPLNEKVRFVPSHYSWWTVNLLGPGYFLLVVPALILGALIEALISRPRNEDAKRDIAA